MEKLNLIENQAEWLKSFSSEEPKSLSVFIIEKAIAMCPDFDSFHLDVVQIPIVEQPSVIINRSVYPSEEEFKLKIISFKKNHKFKLWEYDSCNF